MNYEYTGGKDAVYGHGQYGLPDIPLSEGTFGYAHDFGQTLIDKTRGQVGAGPNLGTSAVGAYQMIGSTMENYAKRAFGENWREVPFTFENQQAVAKEIYNDAVRSGDVSKVWPTARRGDYSNISFEDFSREVLPRESGLSYDSEMAESAPTREPEYLTKSEAEQKLQEATDKGDTGSVNYYKGLLSVFDNEPSYGISKAQAAEPTNERSDMVEGVDVQNAQGNRQEGDELANQIYEGDVAPTPSAETPAQPTVDDLYKQLEAVKSPDEARNILGQIDSAKAAGTQQSVDNLYKQLETVKSPDEARNILGQIDALKAPTRPKSWVGEQVDAAYEALTGESRMTPEMEKLPAIGDAPEMNELSLNAAKAGWSQMFGSDESQKQILQEMGGKISYDAKGNAIVDLPSGQYALNKPGLSPQDVMSGLANIAAYTPAARAGQAIGAAAQFAPAFTRAAVTGLGSMLTEGGLQGITQAAGGEQVNPQDVMLAGALGAGGEVFGAGVARYMAKQKPLFRDGVPEERLTNELKNLGLDYSKLPADVRAELQAMPKDINPADAATVALSRVTDVPLTTGQVTQKRAQQALEKRQGKFAEMQEFQAGQSAKVKEGLTAVKDVGKNEGLGPGEQLGRSLQRMYKERAPRTGPLGGDPEFVKNMRKSGISKNPRTITNELLSEKTPNMDFLRVMDDMDNTGFPGRLARSNLQSATALDLIESSFKGDVFQPDAFIKRMDQIGKPKLEAIFKNKPEELQKLRNFGQLAKKIKNTAGAGEDPTRLRGLVRGLMDNIPVIKYLGPVGDIGTAAVLGAKDKRALQRSKAGKPSVLKDKEELSQNYPAIAKFMGISMAQERDDKLTITARPTMESRTEEE
ncbi:MAG TPA: hypothetical protein VLC98_00050 [Phnomibacter sp.]|nr:hypothetical protein [Phnomibacter sp.]